MSQAGLFTIGLIAYNQNDYLYEALDSILKQTYPKIEIILSDDGTPGFDCSVYEQYIRKHQGANVKNFEVYTQTQNAGTVKNCNFAARHAHGSYFMIFAADDALYDEHVIETFVREFEQRGEGCQMLSAPVAMCTKDLGEITAYVPDEETRGFIRISTPQEMYQRMAAEYTIPATGTCYRMELYEKLGGYDEDYVMIEDASFFIRTARLGYSIGWIDHMTATRHRDGGIAHGNTRNAAASMAKYYKDEILFFEKEVIPYQHLIGEKQWKHAMKLYAYMKNQYWLSTRERLFSVGITVYNNEQYLYEALDSVLNQTYPQLEIIVSDDGTPGFDCSVITRYIEEHKRTNVKHFAVYTQAQNTGTVKNCNFTIQNMHGDYYMFLAADDALYNEYVLETFVREFEKRGNSCSILSGAVAMCTEDLSAVTEFVPDDSTRAFIEQSTPQEMAERLAAVYTIPAAGTCYRMRLYRELGGYDEDYELIEDGPFYIRAARAGYTFGWVEHLVASRHRDGGVSHGNARNHNQTLLRYYEDEALFFEKEVKPYRNQIKETQYQIAAGKYAHVRQEQWLRSRERLFTIGITVYNNARYLTEALDSIFAQTYPKIEIIISDDGSQTFDKKAWEAYIDTHRGDHVCSFKVFAHRKNKGTVKNANFILEQATGDYFMFVAADDALYDGYVLEKYVREFEKRGNSCKCLSASVAMCTDDLEQTVSIVPDQDAVRAICEYTPEQMFERLAHEYTIPAGGTAYRRSLFEADEAGRYDEDYRLIEDGPYFIRLARMGYTFGWISDMTATRHRDGGISHGNRRNHAKAYQTYAKDELLFFEKEVVPYQERIDAASYRLAMDKYEYAQAAYYRQYIRPACGLADRIRYLSGCRCKKAVLWQSIRPVALSVYETLRLIYDNLLRVSGVLAALYLLGRQTGWSKRNEKKSQGLARLSGWLLSGWLLMNLGSTCRYLVRIWRNEDK